eukprot:4829219-Prymnesium_polylepis.1
MGWASIASSVLLVGALVSPGCIAETTGCPSLPTRLERLRFFASPSRIFWSSVFVATRRPPPGGASALTSPSSFPANVHTLLYAC